MFRKMRRTTKEQSREEAERILKETDYGTLALHGDDGYPYSLPVNHLYEDGKIYFHCAPEGHKIDAIRSDEKVSFSAVARIEQLPEKFSTGFLSVVAFGRARIVTDDGVKQSALEAIIEKLAPGRAEAGRKYIETGWDKVTVVEIAVEHLTAKAYV
jgi:nitroimidazol reductase NimA-like FMN-containing flavoprotein (pyridoxamine 5'-phosphate oxidase superfamily)